MGTASNQQRTVLQYNNGSADVIFEFDAVIDEGHLFDSTITDKPIEDGSSTVDHIRLLPRELSMEAHVSNHPIRIPFAQLFEQRDDFLSGVESEDRTKAALEEFEQMQAGAYDLTILTELRTYENMVLKVGSINRNASNANAGVFSLTFRRVRRVQVEIKGDPTQPRQLRGNKKKEKGPGGTTPANQAQKDRLTETGPNNSILYGIFN